MTIKFRKANESAELEAIWPRKLMVNAWLVSSLDAPVVAAMVKVVPYVRESQS